MTASWYDRRAAPAEWELWAPPLDPPESGGLPRAVAEEIVTGCWLADPHEAAALMWESYAAMLPPEPSVTAVSTGVQTVSYAPGGAGGGPFGLAMARAAWHRSMTGSLGSVPVTLAPPPH